MEKFPGNFNVFVPIYTDKKNLALQLIDGKWDEVFSHLLWSAWENAKQDGNFTNWEELRVKLLWEDGKNTLKALQDILEQNSHTELKETVSPYFFRDLQEAITSWIKILSQRKQHQDDQETDATRNAISAYEAWETEFDKQQEIEEDARQALVDWKGTPYENELREKLEEIRWKRDEWNRNNPQPQNPEKVSIHDDLGASAIHQEIQEEALAAIGENPPSISPDAWKDNDRKEVYYIDASWKTATRDRTNTDTLHTIQTYDLQASSIQLSKSLKTRLQKTQEISEQGQEKWDDNLAYRTIEEAIQVIIQAWNIQDNEALSIDDQWSAILENRLPMDIVIPILIQKEQAGLLAWALKSDISWIIRDDDIVKALRILKNTNNKNTSLFTYNILVEQINTLSEENLDELLYILNQYDWGKEKIKALLEKNTSSLSIWKNVSMLKYTELEGFSLEEDSIIELISQRISSHPQEWDDIFIKQRYCETVLRLLSMYWSKHNTQWVIDFIKRNSFLISWAWSISSERQDLLFFIQENAREEALQAWIVKHKRKWLLKRKTNFLEWTI